MAEKKKAPISTHSQASDKKKALETCIAQIEKKLRQGRYHAPWRRYSVNVEALSTGSLSLDLALGIGGVPKGRIIEIYGPLRLRVKNNACAARRRGGSEGRRRGGIHRRRARARACIRPCAGRRYRQSAHLAARYRRAGARHNRKPRALERS